MKKLEMGVYGIFNLVNEKVYVGSTAKTFKGRWNNHRSRLRRNKHYCDHLQRAWNKYGEEKFKFIILERCTILDCINREQYWTDLFRSIDKKMVYNTAPKAGSNLGYKHTSETKDKIGSANKGKKRSDELRARLSRANTGYRHTPEAIAKIRASSKGRKHSQAAKDKVSAAKKGKKRGPQSKEWKENISKSNRGKKRTEEQRVKMSKAQRRLSKLNECDVIQIRKLYSKGNIFRVLAKRFGVSIGTIYRIIHKLVWSHIE